ncbi:transposase [Burkholderia sp. DN3021]|uniref:transposase n=1 Tax=Burkholderia sp. DN3021 TaxID=3410137 RepID=UPI003C7E705D
MRRWEEIDEAVPRPGGERGGRPPFPTELMVRVLVVQQLYNLSDEQMEFQLLDRLSFQRFVGLRSDGIRGGQRVKQRSDSDRNAA